MLNAKYSIINNMPDSILKCITRVHNCNRIKSKQRETSKTKRRKTDRTCQLFSDFIESGRTKPYLIVQKESTNRVYYYRNQENCDTMGLKTLYRSTRESKSFHISDNAFKNSDFCILSLSCKNTKSVIQNTISFKILFSFFNFTQSKFPGKLVHRLVSVKLKHECIQACGRGSEEHATEYHHGKIENLPRKK